VPDIITDDPAVVATTPTPRRTAVAALWAHARRVPLAPTEAGGKTIPARTLRAVLLAITHYCDAEDWSGAFPAMPTIAERAAMSVATARRAVRALETLGVLVTERGGGRRSNRYRIVRPAAPSRPVAPRRSRRSPATPVTTMPRRDRAARSQGPTTPQSSTRPLPRGKRLRAAAMPDDLRPLADALHARGLRAAFALDNRQADDVRATLTRAGISAMVSAAYRHHRANDPARWWSAWLPVWAGLHTPSAPAAVPAPPLPAVPEPVVEGDVAAGAAACRAALAARRSA
jgi:hypothetical protein